ncbi:transcription elongation factor A protein 2 isoform X1 [Sebastes umbrosus]|uniref:transcription elongation factor A protein 2 isoform X1 n=2 Tax=Sebastes umbrosus TaxID=72105 RepID=UPI00189CA888|nr:transcription elongation factor A protein 2 isoform X1 [Sebastes umbrosus]XP_037628073.1 transcription elongation factor A protein 2 isoform X1 [Sebastes umbrosus]
MSREQEVERVARKLDRMVMKKNTDGALDLLRELKNIKMSLETLQSTRVGMSVNAVRKHSSDEEVQTLAKALIKSWKKLLDGSEGKSSEERKKEGSPVRSSSTSKDAGSSEKSSKKSGDSPTTPTAPTAPTTPTAPTAATPPIPQVTSFPPASITTDSVRNKCRELLVAALQTDDDHKTVGAHCEQLAAHIEEEIFQEFKSTDIKYKTRLRSRISNLKDQKNPELRRNVLCGNISARRIASMTAEEMASAELKQMREALTKESIREHQLSKVGGTETDMFICNKCHGKSCSYTQVQIRSADEPMTTFVVCNSCGNRWKFC